MLTSVRRRVPSRCPTGHAPHRLSSCLPNPLLGTAPVPGRSCPKGGVMTRRYETVYIFDSALEEPAITEKLEKFHALLTAGGQRTGPQTPPLGERRPACARLQEGDGLYVLGPVLDPRGPVL